VGEHEDSETSRDQSGDNGKQTCRARACRVRAHLSSPSRLIGGGMPDYRLGRCDGHHEMADFGLRKKVETRGYSL
jgi:hypothetical protein